MSGDIQIPDFFPPRPVVGYENGLPLQTGEKFPERGVVPVDEKIVNVCECSSWEDFKRIVYPEISEREFGAIVVDCLNVMGEGFVFDEGLFRENLKRLNAVAKEKQISIFCIAVLRRITL